MQRKKSKEIILWVIRAGKSLLADSQKDKSLLGLDPYGSIHYEILRQKRGSVHCINDTDPLPPAHGPSWLADGVPGTCQRLCWSATVLSRIIRTTYVII